MKHDFLHQWNRISVGIFALLLIGVAYAAIASQAGHSPGEIEDDVIYVTKSCDNASGNPSDPDYRYKFCQATCPSGPTDYYYAIGGSCKTLPDPNTLTYTLGTGARYNLTGVLSDAQSWNCFNNDLYKNSNDYMEATVVCAKTGGWTALGAQTCGNYAIEGSEVCDGTNFGDWLDCTDFYTGSGEQLCNGTLKCNSTSNACGAFDVSACVYCNGFGGTCEPPNKVCADGTCQPDCAGNGGEDPVGTQGQSCQPGAPCSLISSNPTGTCGDGFGTGPGEVCDPGFGGGDCSSFGSVGVVCPDGSSVQSGYVCSGCTCVPNPAPCCSPGCTSNQDCGLGPSGHGICVMGCCTDTGV